MSPSTTIAELAALRLWPPPARQLAKGVIASSQATLVLPLNGKYESYEILLANFQPAVGGDELRATVSTDGGSTYLSSSYSWSLVVTDASSGTVPVAVPTASGAYLGLLMNVPAGGLGTAVKLEVYAPFNTTDYKGLHWRGSHRSSSSSTYKDTLGNGRVDAASAITHIKFAFSTGSIASGRYVMNGFNG